ncbi:DHHW family protein [Merdimmobilis hominis]|uniref:AlgX/AlgJ SGNH hydrolase-like domain-containing protein n=1 Tax=uncultured Anaerotruncus sp. TaxID=905011 RepID=A0A6N2R949_9FIRM|nr:DHHW family protein [Merdimmobilis hominis]MCD4836665.1 hypothetical protein [Merdimmobilis hominis]PWL57796.1 MAG: hypothetical protein DBY34_08395 [Oscillospiraceae bacterium]
MKEILRYPLVLLFALFILGCTAMDLTQTNREFSEMENRYLQQKPKFTVKTLLNNTYTQKYEEYINDQFFNRDSWITIKSMAESAIGKIENNGIVYGADHYMFEKYRTLDEKRFSDNIRYVKEFAEKYPDRHISLMIVPSSYMVLSEKLPTGLGNLDQYARMEELFAGAAAPNLTAVDPTALLTAHKEDSIYYKTDHHWTCYGAYLGYLSYLESVEGKTPVEYESLPKHQVADFYGTYYSKAKLFNTVPDVIEWFDPAVEQVTIDGEEVDGLHDLQKFEERDKYGAFLRGNNGLTVIKSSAGPGDGSRILVIKDSYGNSFVPYLLYNYDEVQVVDLRAMAGKMSDLLAENDYDDILLLYSFMNFASDQNIPKLRY